MGELAMTFNPSSFSAGELAQQLGIDFGAARNLLNALEAMGLAARRSGMGRAEWMIYGAKTKTFTKEDLQVLADQAKAKILKEENEV